MTNILYPTRGGLSSYANQDQAVALAQEKDAKLFFLYVSNVQFLGNVSRPALVDIVEDELDHMGEFLLAMAAERAAAAEIETESIVRRGDFEEALSDVIEKKDIDILVLGSPGKNNALTTPKFLKKIMTSIVEKYDIEVYVLQDGEIIEHTGLVR